MMRALRREIAEGGHPVPGLRTAIKADNCPSRAAPKFGGRKTLATDADHTAERALGGFQELARCLCAFGRASFASFDRAHLSLYAM